MESYNAGSVALAVVVAKTAYSLGRYWWNRESLKEKFVRRADKEIRDVDIVSVLELELQDVIAEEEEIPDAPMAARKKRVRHGLFRSYLVQQGKAKFGTPRRSAANMLVVRKHLLDVCVDAGLITRHINQHLDIATALVFVPSEAELIGLAVAHTKRSKERVGLRDELGCVQPDIA